MMTRGGLFTLLLALTIFLGTVPKRGDSIIHRVHKNSSLRKLVYKDPTDPTAEYDSIVLDNHLRKYMRGPINDEFAFFTHDVISGYVGPGPPHNVTQGANGPTRTVRAWAMFNIDAVQEIVCDITEIHDYGEEAFFNCPQHGLYIVYATDVEVEVADLMPFTKLESNRDYDRAVWNTKQELEVFNLMLNGKPDFLDKVFSSKRTLNNASTLTLQIKQELIMMKTDVVTSDPVVVRNSYFCYYWMFNLRQTASSGFRGHAVLPPSGSNETNEGGSYILFELRIWVAEPTSVSIPESNDRIQPSSLVVSDYSKVLTNRFHDTGLFPCLRRAHKVIEILSEITYVSEIDQGNGLDGAPHWIAFLKIHTDRLISTLSDITFTIASRQSTGSFHCFVGDTKVYISVREFEFLAQGKQERNKINFAVSDILGMRKLHFEHQLRHVYGHGVQYIGNKFTKLFQPATSRTDMTIVNNPCLSQEFAIAVGGTLYIADRFLRLGFDSVARVVLPDFSAAHGIKTNPDDFRNYLRVIDIAFTPTHVVMLMSDGSVFVHPSSTELMGVGQIADTNKYRPSSLVKRRWCPKTSTPKYSGMMVPLFSRTGNIIVVHLNSVEGSVRMWVTPPSSSCVGEGVGVFTKGMQEVNTLVNETDIHYGVFREVERTNQITGLKEAKPPKRPPREPNFVNLEEETAYLVNDGVLLGDGLDPHFPPELLDSAKHLVGSDLSNYNSAAIYAMENEKQDLQRLMKNNGINSVGATLNADDQNDLGLYTVEFAAVEKQLIAAIQLKAEEIPRSFGVGNQLPFQVVITTVTATNYPFRLKLQTSIKDHDENVDTIVPFPGTILVRSKPFTVKNIKSMDPKEETQHIEHLKGKTEVEFTPEVFIMNTAIPSYVINLGDILVYTSLESRYARPLHFYEWGLINDQISKNRGLSKVYQRTEALTFDNATFLFIREKRLHDAVVSNQGIISVLWRKEKRYHEQDQQDKAIYTQTVAIGSVVSLEGLREVKPFFRHENIFQRVTPEGEVIYGIYETKPHSPYSLCKKGNKTTNWGACLFQTDEDLQNGLRYCARGIPSPCLSPAELSFCPENTSPNMSCILIDELKCFNEMNSPMRCWPLYAPFEEIRSIHFLATPFLSHLLGSLESVESLHPEAPPTNINNGDNKREESGICPFSSFKVYNKDFDFAEVGFQTRITGEVSYFGTGIPTEADLIVEFDSSMGVVVQVSSSVEEQRGLTTIRKTIDISFQMTDYMLSEFSNSDTMEENLLIWQRLEFDDIRAREKSTVFIITIRPSIVDNHCKSTDYFKTVQFNVGCNTFSTVRLISEMAPFLRQNLQLMPSEDKWITHKDTISIPRAHVYHHQVKDKVFDCPADRNSTANRYNCTIPFYDLFQDNIFTVSYRDYFDPKFEQFLTVSARPVKANVVLYDLMGSTEFNVTTNNLQAGCHSMGGYWYDNLVNSTGYIGQGSTVHQNIYQYFVDCFDDTIPNTREQSQVLSATAFRLHNLTNRNRIKFLRQRNQILIFRAVVVNTEYNRFTYCKTLETFFMVRVAGIPIPRQGLALWNYLIIVFLVSISLVITYWIFYSFYTWKMVEPRRQGADTSPTDNKLSNENQNLS